jgi:hypothetical protein
VKEDGISFFMLVRLPHKDFA